MVELEHTRKDILSSRKKKPVDSQPESSEFYVWSDCMSFFCYEWGKESVLLVPRHLRSHVLA